MVNFLPEKEKLKQEKLPKKGAESLSSPEELDISLAPTEKEQGAQEKRELLENDVVSENIKPKAVVHLPKDDVVKEVEDILAEDLGDIYSKLSPDEQKKFKEQGEKVATDISKMIKKGHLKIKRIIKWIRAWLSMILDINRFFLEQKIKIKVDKIVNLNEKMKK